jgi:hypothetical protein
MKKHTKVGRALNPLLLSDKIRLRVWIFVMRPKPYTGWSGPRSKARPHLRGAQTGLVLGRLGLKAGGNVLGAFALGKDSFGVVRVRLHKKVEVFGCAGLRMNRDSITADDQIFNLVFAANSRTA